MVVHSTEGGTAAGVASFFATPIPGDEERPPSTQLVVDDRECWRCLPDLVVPWGAPGVNTSGVHVELCGFAAWTREQWLEHGRELERAAFKCARWSWLYRIPRRWLTVQEIRDGRAGFLRHVDASRAFKTPGGHTDPGAGFPRDVFMADVRRFYREHVAAIAEAAAGAEAPVRAA